MVKLFFVILLMVSARCWSGERAYSLNKCWIAWNETTNRSVVVYIGGGSPQRWYKNIVNIISHGPEHRRYAWARGEYNWLRQYLDPSRVCCWNELVTEWRKISRR